MSVNSEIILRRFARAYTQWCAETYPGGYPTVKGRQDFHAALKDLYDHLEMPYPEFHRVELDRVNLWREKQKSGKEVMAEECREEWDNVNDPPCHPKDEGWKGCIVCFQRAVERMEKTL